MDAYVRPFLDMGHLSGQLLVARGDRIVLERCWGDADQELASKVTPETRFCIASVTKPMTSILAFRMMEQHRIGFRDSIARWLPDFPRGERITIEHLMRHRSGIPHELVPDSLATQPMSAAQMVEVAKRLPLDFEPGSRSNYSSGGFTVLARILEIASGKDYAMLIQDELFGPLAMTHSIHADGRAILPGRAMAYVPGIHGMENAPYQDFSGLVGAGSVWSTARDLHRFVRAVATGRLNETVRQSFVRGGKLDFGGRTGGFRAFADWDSASDLEVVFVGNVITGAPEMLRAALPKLMAGESVPAPELPVLDPDAASPDVLQHYVGSFKLENGVRLELRVRDGVLWANEWMLTPTRDGAFFSPRDYGIIRGVAGADGRIERLDWTQNGQVYPAPRITAAP